MAGPEDIQEVLVGDLSGIVFDLYRLSVVAEVMVGGILQGPASIADARPNDAGGAPEPGVGPPESAEAERCRFGVSWCGRVYRRNVSLGGRDRLSGRDGRGSPSAGRTEKEAERDQEQRGDSAADQWCLGGGYVCFD